MYYLQSRYYNPEWGRFINADALVSTGQGLLGNNMFAYCRNNPVRRIDVSGSADQDCIDDQPLDDEDILKVSAGGGGSGDTSIYRYGYTGAEKMVPSTNDVNTNTGLSFSTRPKPGSAVTTIETVNSTGTLRAVQDGKYHVSIYPVGGTVADWHAAGANSIWTQTLISIIAISKS